MHNLNSNIKVVQSWASELERTINDRDTHITEERERNLKAFQEINVSLAMKDKRTLKLLKSANDLINRVNGLSSQLEKAKSIMVDSY